MEELIWPKLLILLETNIINNILKIDILRYRLNENEKHLDFRRRDILVSSITQFQMF